MKKCQHGDLVPVTVKSLCQGTHIENVPSGTIAALRQSVAVQSGTIKINYICNRILASKLFRTLMRI